MAQTGANLDSQHQNQLTHHVQQIPQKEREKQDKHFGYSAASKSHLKEIYKILKFLNEKGETDKDKLLNLQNTNRDLKKQ